MKTKKKCIAIKPFSAKSIENQMDKITKWINLLIFKRFTFTRFITRTMTLSLLAVILLSACKKDIELVPLTVNTLVPDTTFNTPVNDTTLKAGVLTYYISPNGSDAAKGDITHPWKTLVYACKKVTAPGSVIYLTAGNYTESNICNVSVGVSIKGAGKNVSIIHCRNKTDKTLYFTSAALTAGNQTISDIGFDGDNLTGFRAIVVRYRYNVSIHDCNFKNFQFMAASISNGAGYTGVRPTTYAQGNQFYNNTIDNCSIESPNGSSAVFFTGQLGLKFYGNTINCPSRGSLHGGFGYKNDWMKGTDFHNNTISVPTHDDLESWSFAVEMWHTEQGTRIYNNTIRGVLDIVDTQKGDSSYAVKVYNNYIGFTTAQAQKRQGMYLEGSVKDIEIYNNTFNYLTTFISFYTTSTPKFSNINIHNNVFSNLINLNSSSYAFGIYSAGSGGFAIDNLKIDNNTFKTSIANTYSCIILPVRGTVTNVLIRNNIIAGFGTAITSGATASGTITNVWIQNNCLYGNGNSNNIVWGGVIPKNITQANTLKVNPLFVSSTNLHLQSGSPVINKGINVGLHFNGSAPDLGSFEY